MLPGKLNHSAGIVTLVHEHSVQSAINIKPMLSANPSTAGVRGHCGVSVGEQLELVKVMRRL